MDSDSDFYGTKIPSRNSSANHSLTHNPGDEDEIRDLESRASAYNPASYWRDRARLFAVEPAMSVKREPASQAPTAATTTGFHNPYEGRMACAKQLGETVEAFLTRLPPDTTDVTASVPWIYVANPYIPREDRGGQEAPEEFGAQVAKFVEGGEARLEMFGDLLRELREKSSGGGGGGSRGARAGPSKAAVRQEIDKQREGCVNDLLMLAKVLKVRTGKVSSSLISLLWDIYSPQKGGMLTVD